MRSREYTPILLSSVRHIDDFEQTREVLADLIDDINTRFSELYGDATGRSQSISQTALVSVATGLAATPLLGVGVLFQLSATAAMTIPGFSGGYGGRVVVIQNTSSHTYTIAHESGTALPEHRVTSRTGASLTVAAGAGLVLVYDDTTSRWIPVCTQL